MRDAFHKIMHTADAPPGVGPCHVLRSRNVKPIDEEPARAITCFFIAKHARGAGLSHRLVDAAVKLAKYHGARLIEGYPVDAARGRRRPIRRTTGSNPYSSGRALTRRCAARLGVR